MPLIVACPCSKRLRLSEELVGRRVRCPSCSEVFRVPAQPPLDRRPVPPPFMEQPPPASAVRARRATPATACAAATTAVPAVASFPTLGYWIGSSAVTIGILQMLGGCLLTIFVLCADGDFKPAGLVVFMLPGVIWTTCGTLLLKLRRRFVNAFAGFLLLNFLAGVFFTRFARQAGSSSDAQIFAATGLGFILTAVVFQLFHGFLMRDVRRAKRGE